MFLGEHCAADAMSLGRVAFSLTPRPIDHPSMKPVVATFASSADAVPFAKLLREELGLAESSVNIAVVAAYGEPHDAHQLVVAWVPDDRENEVNATVATCGGILQPQPWTRLLRTIDGPGKADAPGADRSPPNTDAAGRGTN
jgi:hypothetical protein